ncbi:MAG: tetratricopeptide repeat protein [candidate division Zixibacteria bacterium]|nr:tetratricopeptide repeat protein [candidate division Zixibacteria bacterium]
MRIRSYALLALIGLLAVGCAQSLYMQGRGHLQAGRYDPAIDAFYKEIAANPTSVRAWRELGVAYYEKGDLGKAEEALKQASGIKPDARTHLYLGLLFEKQEDYGKAVDAYAAALSLRPGGKTASATRAHLDRLISRRIETEVSWALDNESAIDADTIPENTIAVANFDGSGLPPELAPITLGLAEFTASDLAKVASLTVVERLRLDAILQELELSESGYVDRSTAPRLGRLMGSRRLVTGTVLSIGDEGLKLDGAVVNTTDSSSHLMDGVEGKLAQFFKLQKQLVFSIIDDLGISLSAAERDAISEVPTESYLAFLAYCRGLDYQKRGMPGPAAREFSEATELDNSFEQADRQRTLSEGRSDDVSYQESFTQLEGAAGDDAVDPQDFTPGMDSYMSTMLDNSGMTDQGIIESLPVEEGTGKVKIRGDLDAQ